MNWKENELQLKVLVGYLTVLVVIGGMLFVLLYGRGQMKKMEKEHQTISKVHRQIQSIHRCVTELATRGESVMVWEEDEQNAYHVRRMQVDSLLLLLRRDGEQFIHPELTDTLRYLLEEKERHLFHLMKTFHQQELADSLLIYQFPVAIKDATRPFEKIRKKKGIAGLFGQTETIRIMPSAQKLYALNDSLITMQEERKRNIGLHTDLLRFQNRELNRRLSVFITSLDGQAQSSFEDKIRQMSFTWETINRLLTGIFLVAIVLLLVFYWFIHRDIVRREKIRKKLQHTIEENDTLLRMRKNIILTVSHDIRGPLGNIINSTELAMDTRDRKKRNGYLKNILGLSQRIRHLVNDLMDVYRINETKEILNETAFRLEELLQRAADNYSMKANDKGLVFESDYRHTDIIVMGDADKLDQVLDNLLTNAIKFTLSGSIHFCAEYSDAMLRLEVRDTGIGMDRETLNRIFQPFERAAQDINSEGFGLGLYITNGLVNALGGTMQVESRPGVGSTFSLTFPLPETDEIPEEEEAPLDSSVLLPRKVLLVDDDPILLKIAEDMLERNGIVCAPCADIKQVVERLRESDYDLVLTDIQMPGTDGFGLLKLLRNSDIGNSRTIPVSAMTARHDGASGIYLKAGFQGCLYKPFSMKGLLRFLSEVACKEELVFNFSTLIDGVSDRNEIFRLVIQESRKDMAELEEGLQAMNRKRLRETVHRMFPTWELLGVSDFLQGYRELLHNGTEKEISAYTLRVLTWINKLIEESEKELVHEIKDIDSGR